MRGVTAIFGPSGCGKTTVLRCVAGLQMFEDGYLSIGSEIWQDGAHSGRPMSGGLEAERAALSQTERERFVAQALSRLSAEATGAAVTRKAGVPGSRRQHPRRPGAHDGAPDHHRPARRRAAERVRRRRPVRPVPRGWHRRQTASGYALCRRRGLRARAALPQRRLRRLRPPAGRGADHRAAWGAGRAARAGRARGEDSARARPITVVVNVTAADASSFRASQGQIAADMACVIDRARRNR
jgi:energy-coupling factor transporter ATP-binding protein EcfA2